MEITSIGSARVATRRGASLPTLRRIPTTTLSPVAGPGLCPPRARNSRMYGAQVWQRSVETGEGFARMSVLGGNHVTDAFSTRVGPPPPQPAV